MTLTILEKLNLLYRSKVIKEMTLEDLEIWKEYKNIYPSCLRFPESVEWNWDSTIRNRKECIRNLNKSLKRIEKYIRELIKFPRGKSDKELSLFIKKQKKMLKIHLKKLKEFRDGKFNNRLKIPPLKISDLYNSSQKFAKEKLKWKNK